MEEKRTVLFVDDEEKTLRAIKRTLVGEPFNIFLAESGKEGLEILEKNEVHILVADLRMPEMNGFALLEIVKKEYPHIIRVVLSGYADIDNLLRAINQGQILRFITKPWKSDEEFKTIIRQAIEYYDLHSEREMLMTFFEQLLDGTRPEEMNFRLIQTLMSKHKRHLYEWNRRCDSVVQEQQSGLPLELKSKTVERR